MTRPLSDLILEFVAALREAGVRISVAESLDAMRAVGAAGLALGRMREALRAALIKDEVDSPTFDTLFAKHFRGSTLHLESEPRRRGVRIGVGGGRGRGDTAHPPAAIVAKPIPPESGPGKPASAEEPADERLAPPEKTESERTAGRDEPRSSAQRRGRVGDREEAAALDGNGAGEPRDEGDYLDTDHGGVQAGLARLRRIERLPFAEYSTLDYEQARDTLALLRRRWQTRLGRRLHSARRGRLDFRRTIRASLQHGGLALERLFRARHPRHLDLVVLADVSGSMRYASLLVLELLAGASREFRRIRGFVYIDRLAAADFEGGHLVMTPTLDMYARSDAGRVFGEIRANHWNLLNRATVMVILGDARNNKRPPFANLLRDIANRCRAVLWLNPEPPARWNTGDSAIEAYRRVIDYVLPCGSLLELQACLSYIC